MRNNFSSKLNELSRNAAKLGQTKEIRITELFTDSFMARYTNYSSFQAFMDASGFTVESQEDFQAIPDAEWNTFVSANTQFSRWEDMFKQAGHEWTRRQLGL